MEFNFNRALFFAPQRLDSPGMRLKPEQAASISAVYKDKDVFIWLPTGFGKSVCYERTLFLTETIPFVMDCKLRRVGSESGKYSLVLVHTSHHLARGFRTSYAPPHIMRFNEVKPS